MYPSECGRALKCITCKGKNGSSIIPKRDAEKWKLFYQPYYQKHQNTMQKGLQQKRTSQITGHFSKQIPTPAHRQHKKNNKPNPGPSLPNPTSKQTCTHTHTLPHTPPKNTHWCQVNYVKIKNRHKQFKKKIQNEIKRLHSRGIKIKSPLFKVFSEFPFTNSNFILNIPLSLNQIHEGNKTEI